MTRIVAGGILIALVLAAGTGAVAAPTDNDRQEVRQRMRALFEARLRADLGLDDAATARVAPKLEAVEREHARAQRERMRLLRELRRGLATGVGDAGLQERLDALDRLARDSEAATRAGLAEVDRELTVPQRVRLRFLMAEFRSEMSRRLRELRRR